VPRQTDGMARRDPFLAIPGSMGGPGAPLRRRVRPHEIRMSRTSHPTRMGRIVALATLALLAIVPGPAAAAPPQAALIDGVRPVHVADPVRVELHVLYAPRSGARARERVAARPAGGSPCSDRANRVGSSRWTRAYAWTFFARSTPDNLTRRATARALKRAATNITAARNDCGRVDRVSATQTYLGGAAHKPAPTRNGTCGPMDQRNAVGFGPLPSGIAGLTCIWSSGDRIVEADIKLDRRSRWSISVAGCSFAAIVEAVATHEFGHVFGLGHVREDRHGRLTMSTRLDGHCQDNESTLGVGDMLGLEKLY
jgi:hypothetical protein